MDTLCLIKSFSDELDREGICVCQRGIVVYFNEAFGNINPQAKIGDEIRSFYSENINIYFSSGTGRRYDIKRININGNLFALIYRPREESNTGDNDKLTSFYKMSHDLRSPLNAILSVTGCALMTDVENPMEYIRKIKNTADYMFEVINSVLKRAEKEYNKRFCLRQAVEQAAEICRINADKKGQKILFFIGEDCELKGSPLVLKQVIINLASNAIKYTDEGGTIEINVNADNSRSGHTKIIKLSVKDNGRGIDEKIMDKIFMPFEKFSDNDVNSSGLGLYIIKEKIEKLGGEIYVKSEKGRGSVFFAEIPFNTAKP